MLPWLAHPVLVCLKLLCGPCTIKPLFHPAGWKFRIMPGNGLMNDAWLAQAGNPFKTVQISHDASGTWRRICLVNIR
jgi:hypothetical protein